MILPLGIVTTLRPVRGLRPEQGIAELYLDREAGNRLGEAVGGLPRDWRSFFLLVDQFSRHTTKARSNRCAMWRCGRRKMVAGTSG